VSDGSEYDVSGIALGALKVATAEMAVRAAGELLDGIDDDSERVVIRVARQRLGMEHELAARGASIGGNDRGPDAELVGGVGLALADAIRPRARGRNKASIRAGAAAASARGSAASSATSAARLPTKPNCRPHSNGRWRTLSRSAASAIADGDA
jgi:hypothetical protein